MSLSFRKGDMFSVPVEALVNTVNCVGVMGKGVALEFKRRWPENYKLYKKACSNHELEPGKLLIFETGQLLAEDGHRYLVNFPTKIHWRAKSKLEYVRSGLDALARAIVDYDIKSIALPPLGCGNGGLDWKDVKPLIISHLLPFEDVEIIVFSPADAIDGPEYIHPTVSLTFERAVLVKAIGDLEHHFDGALDRISLQKITYFLQALGVNFRLEFARNLHGPYSEALRKSFIALEKSQMISGFVKDDRKAHATAAGYALADEYLYHHDGQEKATDLIKRLDMLIEGYESPYGLELLSSVHWLANHEKHYPLEKIIEAMKAWSDDKRNRYDDKSIQLAYQRLEKDGLLNALAR